MNILVTGAWRNAEAHLNEIRALGNHILYMQEEHAPLPCEAAWVEGVICNGLFLYHPIEAFTNLRYIQLTSAGLDRVNLPYIQKKRITLYNARGVYSIPMAEYALAGVLSIYKRMAHFRDLQRDHCWMKDRNLMELCGHRVLVIGCGNVGTECAKRFKAFGCSVIGLDLVVREDLDYDNMKQITGENVLDEELCRADVIVLTLPLSEETRGIISRRRLALLKHDVVLVNIARGAVVDQKALEEWDGYAVLDVFEDEPLSPESPIWEKEKFLVTPHNSFVGEGNERRLAGVIFDHLKSFALL